jgi:hypothetical protein
MNTSSSSVFELTWAVPPEKSLSRFCNKPLFTSSFIQVPVQLSQVSTVLGGSAVSSLYRAKTSVTKHSYVISRMNENSYNPVFRIMSAMFLWGGKAAALFSLPLPLVRPSAEMSKGTYILMYHFRWHLGVSKLDKVTSSWEELLLDCPLVCLFKHEAMKRDKRYHMPVTLVITWNQRRSLNIINKKVSKNEMVLKKLL